MASNSSCGDPSTTGVLTTTVATALTSDPTIPKTSVVATATVAFSAQSIASAPKLQPTSQPRTPQFLQHHPQHHNPPRHHQYNHQHQLGIFGTPTLIQTQTHLYPHLANASDPPQYPLASSGRGLLPSPTVTAIRPQLPEQVAVANSGAYPPMPSTLVPNSCTHQYQHQHQHQHSRLAAPTEPSHPKHLCAPFSHPSRAHMSSVSISSAARGIPLNNPPQSKAVSSPYFAPDSNAPKDPIDRDLDDKLVTLRDRKVKVTDGASFYALCRSWLRNGYVEENQLQFGDVFKSLPEPLPPPESFSPKRKESDDEVEVDEAEEPMTAKELLTMHVKRAKRVRARLREERLQRIERYKSRLALLLPHNGTMQE